MGRLFRPWTTTCGNDPIRNEHSDSNVATGSGDATISSGYTTMSAPLITQDSTVSTTSRSQRTRKPSRRDAVLQPCPVPLSYNTASTLPPPPPPPPPPGAWSYAPEVTCCAEAAMLEEYGRLLREAQLQQQLKYRKQRPKKFRCPHCQVAFSNNGQLKGHVRIHTGGCGWHTQQKLFLHVASIPSKPNGHQFHAF